MQEYKKCYIAFMDLLGFKEMVRYKDCDYIFNLFEEIKKRNYIRGKFGDEYRPIIPDDEIHYKIMSDSICIYIEDKYEAALSFVVSLATLFQVKMLEMQEPVLVRGGIYHGDLYFDNDIIYGPSLTQAYLLGEKVAKVPRIIIPMNIIEENTHISKYGGLQFIFKDSDSFYTTRYIELFCKGKTYSPEMKRLNDFINHNLYTIFDENIRRKYLYVNSIFSKIYREEKQ